MKNIQLWIKQKETYQKIVSMISFAQPSEELVTSLDIQFLEFGQKNWDFRKWEEMKREMEKEKEKERYKEKKMLQPKH